METIETFLIMAVATLGVFVMFLILVILILSDHIRELKKYVKFLEAKLDAIKP